jgi:Tfp pilus assembly protein PilO
MAMTNPKAGCGYVHAIGAGCCLALTVAGYLLVARPVIRTQLDQASLRAELLGQQQKLVELDRAERALENKRHRIEQDLAHDQLRLQGVGHLNRRLALIVDSAVASDIVLNETRSGTITAGQMYQTVPISLTGTGSYPGFAAYLRRLHERLPDTCVVSFELAGNPGREDTPGRFRYDLLWYAAPAVAEAR